MPTIKISEENYQILSDLINKEIREKMKDKNSIMDIARNGVSFNEILTKILIKYKVTR